MHKLDFISFCRLFSYNFPFIQKKIYLQRVRNSPALLGFSFVTLAMFLFYNLPCTLSNQALFVMRLCVLLWKHHSQIPLVGRERFLANIMVIHL